MIYITWVLTILSLIGVVLNIKKRKECFYIWGATNFGWVFIDYQAELYAQSFLFAIYFFLAIWGLYAWRRDV